LRDDVLRGIARRPPIGRDRRPEEIERKQCQRQRNAKQQGDRLGKQDGAGQARDSSAGSVRTTAGCSALPEPRHRQCEADPDQAGQGKRQEDAARRRATILRRPADARIARTPAEQGRMGEQLTHAPIMAGFGQECPQNRMKSLEIRATHGFLCAATIPPQARRKPTKAGAYL